MSTTYRLPVTPISIRRDRTARGFARLTARLEVENRNGKREHDAVCYGRRAERLSPFFQVGRRILLAAQYAKTPAGRTDLVPVDHLHTYPMPEPRPVAARRPPAEPTGRTVEGHDREEHWRWQRCGKGRTELRRVRVRASKVNGGSRTV